MFGKPIHLFTLLGFRIRLDPSWFLLAILVTWTLAVSLFPQIAPGLTNATYWAMGIAGALGLFVSIVIHEFFHAVVARKYDIPMRGITLFIFGGIAEMESEPPTAKSEFLMAGAGPLASVGLGLLGFAAYFWLGQLWPVWVGVVVSYLAQINIILAVFNMVPAFPLDGGRMLRAVLWHRMGSLRRATRISSAIGSGFGIVMIVIGIVWVLQGQIVAGAWWIVLGLFLRSIAGSSYQHVLLKRALEGEPVRRFMRTEPVTVAPDTSVESLVNDYVYRHHFKLYPVVDQGRLVGCVTTRQIRDLPREEWPRRSVRDLASSCSPANTISPDADALDALRSMRQSGVSRMLVADNGELVGVLSLRDLLEFFALKVELEGASG